MSVRSSRFAYGLGEPLILQQRRRRAPRDWLCGFDIDPPYAAWFLFGLPLVSRLRRVGARQLKLLSRDMGKSKRIMFFMDHVLHNSQLGFPS